MLALEAIAPAAKACNDYVNIGKDDWFLPSRDELNQLYINQSHVDGLSANPIWSSSQLINNIGTAWYQSFSSGYQGTNSKGNDLFTCIVRAIRAF
ncbi:MAG: DUF1566 domain-containing protein [Treponema sp.]|nr:DUF1566 domain-containing protein [Treponema sp.]